MAGPKSVLYTHQPRHPILTRFVAVCMSWILPGARRLGAAGPSGRRRYLLQPVILLSVLRQLRTRSRTHAHFTSSRSVLSNPLPYSNHKRSVLLVRDA